jgi:hypothetical protein
VSVGKLEVGGMEVTIYDLGLQVDQIHGLLVQVLQHGFKALAHPTIMPLQIQRPTPHPLYPLRDKPPPINLIKGHLRRLHVKKPLQNRLLFRLRRLLFLLHLFLEFYIQKLGKFDHVYCHERGEKVEHVC